MRQINIMMEEGFWEALQKIAKDKSETLSREAGYTIKITASEIVRTAIRQKLEEERSRV